jgi:hypothetical protein
LASLLGPGCSTDDASRRDGADASPPAADGSTGGVPTVGGGATSDGGAPSSAAGTAGGLTSGADGVNPGGHTSSGGMAVSDGGTAHRDAGADGADSGSGVPGSGGAPASSVGAGTAPVGTPCTGAAATVHASQTSAEIQTIFDAQPVGAVVCFTRGTYRIASALSPRQGQTLHGEAGAVLNGAVVVTGFAPSGATWVKTGAVFASAGSEANAEPWCEDTTTHSCSYDEWVFLDGAPLARAPSRDALTQGSFFADYGAKALYLGSDPAGHTVELESARAAIRIAASEVIVEGGIRSLRGFQRQHVPPR